MFEKFNDDTIQKVWEKGEAVSGINPAVRRKDICGAWIDKNMYGNTNGQNNSGWQIDHIVPESQGGTDDLSNLRPLQWYNNDSRKDGLLKCPVTAR